ncbi:hypothetical protein EJB05_47149 [Eragrostis curvula]|uniref:Uncharacterized protein n=1 Tax=Eragrostis curvula TaxID=38414 RepID=A0A5J9T7Z5_9POAL|nr:hypothetical protein EJB05_47149 [Eragrostis curvula]
MSSIRLNKRRLLEALRSVSPAVLHGPMLGSSDAHIEEPMHFSDDIGSQGASVFMGLLKRVAKQDGWSLDKGSY